MKFGEMQFGAVALVLAEAILGKLRAEVTHHPVARDLGDDTGRGDRKADAIAIDDGGLGQGKGNDGQAVDQNVLWWIGQGFERDPHGPVGGAQDIDSIDLKMVDHANGPDNFGVTDQLIVNLLAQFGRELFGVLQFSMPKLLRQNRDRRHHRPGQRPASGLIDSSDANDADGAQFLFIAKAAAPIHGKENTEKRKS